MKKTIFGVALAMVLALGFCLSVTAEAITDEKKAEDAVSVDPFWLYTSSITLTLTFKDNIATCSCNIMGQPDTVRIEPAFTLKEKQADGSWLARYSWLSAASGDVFNWSDKVEINKGKTYGLYVSATVTNRDGKTENVQSDVVKTAP